VTPGSVLNQSYTVNDALVIFTVPDFTQTGSCGPITYTNSVTPAALFVGDNGGTGTTFTWQTSDNTLQGNSYTLQVTANFDSTSVSTSFDLMVLADPTICMTPTTFTAPASQTDPSVYQYSLSPASFSFTPFTIAPAICVPSYSCTSVPINLCAVNSGSSQSTFSTTSGDFTFVSQDAAMFPPGQYLFTISVTAGDQTKTAGFTLTIQYPPLVLLTNPFSDITQELGSAPITLTFAMSQMVTPVVLGQVLIQFTKEDGFSKLQSQVFSINTDENGNQISPLTIDQI
jgi:hypothetical protein